MLLARHILAISMLQLLVSGSLAAQVREPGSVPTESPAVANRLAQPSIGFQIHQVQRDFGIGVHVTTPYFHNVIALRAGVSRQWLDHIPAGANAATWDPYLQVRFGVASRNTVIADALSIYSEGGLLYLRPNAKFSGETSELGGYGVLGVEFHASRFLGQFLEVGGVGTGANADRAEGNPIYSNGLIVSAGMRWYR